MSSQMSAQMSAQISSTDFIQALQRPAPGRGANTAQSAQAGGAEASFAVRLAEFRAQTLGSLMSSTFGATGANQSADVNALLGTQNESSDPLSALAAPGSNTGLSASGRNTALFDPESAYQMMSIINGKEVTYKAQFSELSEMKAELYEMQDEGSDLSGLDAAASAETIVARLQAFVDRFNDWDERFDPAMQQGGILADTQAAEVSRHELRASIQNPFIGAEHGLHGLRDLGITIEQSTGQAIIDPAKLNAALTHNPSAVAQTVQAFGSHFARSAELLNSAGNFIPNRLNNLDRVIDYIEDHSPALQAEFGRGDPAKPSGQIARALAEYNRTYNS